MQWFKVLAEQQNIFTNSILSKQPKCRFSDQEYYLKEQSNFHPSQQQMITVQPLYNGHLGDRRKWQL